MPLHREVQNAVHAAAGIRRGANNVLAHARAIQDQYGNLVGTPEETIRSSIDFHRSSTLACMRVAEIMTYIARVPLDVIQGANATKILETYRAAFGIGNALFPLMPAINTLRVHAEHAVLNRRGNATIIERLTVEVGGEQRVAEYGGLAQQFAIVHNQQVIDRVQAAHQALHPPAPVVAAPPPPQQQPQQPRNWRGSLRPRDSRGRVQGG